MSRVSSIVPKSRFRRIAKSGAFSAARFNANQQEMIQELQELQAIWNDQLVPLLRGLPLGSDDDEFPAIGDSIDPIANGLSGDQVWADNEATSTSGELFWSTADSRKLTIKESLLAINATVDSNFATLQELVSSTSSGASSYTRSYIGLKAFDTTLVSDSGSIDGKVTSSQFNVSQLMSDAFGGNYSLDADGVANLGYPIQQVIDALLDINGGAAYKSGLTYGTTVTLSAAAVTTGDLSLTTSIPATWIGPVLPSTATAVRAAPITSIGDEIKRLRFEIARLKGPTAAWNNDTGIAPAYSAALVSLGQHIGQAGNGTASGSNPHGLAAEDIDYDNATSGLTATDVNAAIDEVSASIDALAVSTTKYLEVGSFSNLPADTAVKLSMIPYGYQLVAIYLRHEDGNGVPIVPTAGTLTVQRDDDGAVTNHLTAASIALSSLTAEGTMLTVDVSNDAGDGTLLDMSPLNVEYTFPEVLRLSVVNLACNPEAELYVWIKVQAI